MLKVMEKMTERLAENNIQVVREQNEPQIRNPDFRQPRKHGLSPPQILQRGQRNQNQNQIDQVRPHFQENMIDDAFAQQTEDHRNQFGDKGSKVFLTEEEHYKFTQDTDQSNLEDRLDEYQRGYQNAMVDQNHSIKL